MNKTYIYIEEFLKVLLKSLPEFADGNVSGCGKAKWMLNLENLNK